MPPKKLQAPSSKSQGSTKHQAPGAIAHDNIGIWNLELLWSLELGIWSFPRRYGVAAGLGLLKSNFTSGAFSAPAAAVKNGRGLKPNILFNMLVGNRSRAVLYSWTAVLKLFRSTEIRFSVPSSWAWRFWNASVARSCG